LTAVQYRTTTGQITSMYRQFMCFVIQEERDGTEFFWCFQTSIFFAGCITVNQEGTVIGHVELFIVGI